MNRRKLIPFIIILLLIVPLMGIITARADLETTPIYSVANTGCADAGDATTFGMQRKVWWMNDRFWVWYSDGTNMQYESSTDGTSWVAAPTVIRTCDSGQVFGTEYTYTGDKIAYVWGDVHHYPGSDGMYRVGTPQSGGTITWDAVEQSFIDSSFQPVLAFDSDNNPWVATLTGYLGTTWVTKSWDGVAFTPNNDTFIYSAAPDNTYGHLAYVAIGFDPNTARGIVKFDTSSLSGATIISATLRLYYYAYQQGDPVDRSVDLHRCTTDWAEDTATWNSPPTHDASATDTVSWPAAYGWVEFNVTDDVVDWASGAESNYGHLIKFTSEGAPNEMVLVYSKEQTGALIPQLLVKRTGLPVGEWRTPPGFPYQLNATAATDRGTWAQPISPGAPGSPDMFVMWNRQNQRILGRYWNGTTEAWDAQEYVTPVGVTIQYPYKKCGIGENGRIHIVYNGQDSNTYYTMRNTAGTWSTPVNLTPSTEYGEMPQLVHDEYGTNMYLVYMRGSYLTKVRYVSLTEDTTVESNWTPWQTVADDTGTAAFPLGLTVPRVSVDAKVPVVYTYQDGAQTVRFTYFKVAIHPTVGEFTTTDATPDADTYFNISLKIKDGEGHDNLTYVDMRVHDGAIYADVRYNHTSDTFSEIADPSGVCTLDVSGSADSIINATALKVDFKVKFTAGLGAGQKSVNATVWDVDGYSGTGSHANLFNFQGAPEATIVLTLPTHSATGQGVICTFGITLTSTESPLSRAVLSTKYGAAAWVNETYVSVSGFSDTASKDKTLPPTIGTTVYYKWFGRTVDLTWNVSTVTEFLVTEEEEPETDIVHAELVNGEVDGTWVFVGRRLYDFYVIYSGATGPDELIVSMKFTDDAGDEYILEYDYEHSTFTLTSPDDGITASVYSAVEDGNNLKVHWYVIFNPPVSDTLGVTLYCRARITGAGDTGWEATSVVFNIYNEGGFATLTASGWAGRTPGGDVFEIYAADTRTKDLIQSENFDVREKPINWWEFGTSEQDLTDELIDWLISMPSRDVNHTVYPTNRRPDGAPAGVTTYFNFSYPFGLRVIDYPNSHLDHIFAEKQFRRPVTAVTGELVIVQVYAMTPEDSGTVGRIVISDTGLYNKWVGGGAFPNEAVEFKFDGGGNFKAIDNFTWTQVATYNAWQWYNITFVLDMTAQTFDIYVDEVLSANDFEFDDVGCVSVEYLTLGQYVWAVGNYTDVYFDDVLAKTDFDGNYGGDAKATALFRYLQHWSMDWDFKVEEGSEYVQGYAYSPYGSVEDYSNHGFIELGWDVCINGTWENNFLVARINITDGKVRSNYNWVEFNITWTQNGTYKKHDLLYGLFGTFKAEAEFATKDATGWHWDIWFNSMNASTVVGGRLNTEYFGMTNKATWSWGSNWKPVHSDFTESACFVDLDDSSGVTHSVKEVDMVRPWVRVYRDNRSTFHYAIANIETEFPETSETMSGIDTPEIQDTMVPQGPPPSGLGAFLSSAIKRIMEDMLVGMLMVVTNLGTITVGLIDFIGGIIGFPQIMSNMVSVVDNAWGFFTTIMSELFLFSMIGAIFTVITNTFGFLIAALMRFVGFFFGTATHDGLFPIVAGIFDGTSTFISGLTSLWGLISPDDWPAVLDFITVMAVISWAYSIDERARKAGGGWVSFFTGDLQIITWIASFFWDLSIKIMDMTLGIILRIMLILKR